MTKPSCKGFHLAMPMSSIGHDDAELKSLLLSCSDISDSAMMMPTQKRFYLAATTSLIWPRRCTAGRSSTWLWQCLWFGHDKPKSKSLLLGRGDVSESTRTKPSWEVLYSVAVTSPIRQRRSPIGRSSTRPWRRLLFVHDEALMESLLLGCDGVFDSAMTKPSHEGFYSTAPTSSIQP